MPNPNFEIGQTSPVTKDEIRRRLAGPADTVPFVLHLHDLALEDPLCALTAVGKLRAVLDDAEALAIVAARGQRLTWRAIGDHLRIPIQTTHRRFRHLDPHS